MFMHSFLYMMTFLHSLAFFYFNNTTQLVGGGHLLISRYLYVIA